MAVAHRNHWNQRYDREYYGQASYAQASYGQAVLGRRPPRAWLLDHLGIFQMRAQLIRLADRTPTALDLACGPGRNILCLAEEGWHVTGVDISDRAIALAQEQADRAGLSARTRLIVADLDQWRPEPASFDLVSCFFFLDRTLWPAMRQAVRPDGLLIVETFNAHRQDDFAPEFLLQPGELHAEVRSWGWDILAWRSDGPDLPRPTDAIVAVKPAWLMA